MGSKLESTILFLRLTLDDLHNEMHLPCYPYRGLVYSELEKGKNAIHSCLSKITIHKKEQDEQQTRSTGISGL